MYCGIPTHTLSFVIAIFSVTVCSCDRANAPESKQNGDISKNDTKKSVSIESVNLPPLVRLNDKKSLESYYKKLRPDGKQMFSFPDPKRIQYGGVTMNIYPYENTLKNALNSGLLIAYGHVIQPPYVFELTDDGQGSVTQNQSSLIPNTLTIWQNS